MAKCRSYLTCSKYTCVLIWITGLQWGNRSSSPECLTPPGHLQRRPSCTIVSHCWITFQSKRRTNWGLPLARYPLQRAPISIVMFHIFCNFLLSITLPVVCQLPVLHASYLSALCRSFFFYSVRFRSTTVKWIPEKWTEVMCLSLSLLHHHLGLLKSAWAAKTQTTIYLIRSKYREYFYTAPKFLTDIYFI